MRTPFVLLIILIVILCTSQNVWSVRPLGSKTTFKDLPITEWSTKHVSQFFDEHFPHLSILNDNSEEALWNGHDLLVLDREELRETLLSRAAVDQSWSDEQIDQFVDDVINQIQHHVDIANGSNDSDEPPTKVDLLSLWDAEDVLNRKPQDRRYNLDRVEKVNRRAVFVYAQLFNTQPTITMAYLYWKDPILLRRILHLPEDYTFTIKDYFLYTIFARPFIIYRIYSLGYMETEWLPTLVLIIGQSAQLAAAIITIVTRNKLALLQVFSAYAMSFVTQWYIVPEAVFSWKAMILFIALQSIMSIPQLFLASRTSSLLETARQMKAQAQTNNNTEHIDQANDTRESIDQSTDAGTENADTSTVRQRTTTEEEEVD